MADERDPVAEAALAAAARHALHDEELVAGFAAGGLETDDEAAQARALIERCTVCRDLHRDVAAIGAALAAEATFRTVAPRDFRLTVEDAHRLGGRVVTRGFVAAFGRWVVTFARPVGATLATFGLIGVLVSSANLGGAAGTTFIGAPAPAASLAPAEIQAGGTPPEGPKATSADSAYAPAATGDGRTSSIPGEREPGGVGPNPIVWLLGGSVAMLVAGLGLLIAALRRGGGRSPHG